MSQGTTDWNSPIRINSSQTYKCQKFPKHLNAHLERLRGRGVRDEPGWGRDLLSLSQGAEGGQPRAGRGRACPSQWGAGGPGSSSPGTGGPPCCTAPAGRRGGNRFYDLKTSTWGGGCCCFLEKNSSRTCLASLTAPGCWDWRKTLVPPTRRESSTMPWTGVGREAGISIGAPYFWNLSLRDQDCSGAVSI